MPGDASTAALTETGVPEACVWLLNCLFTTVLDGRNAHLTDGVRRALGREPRNFGDFAGDTAASDVWNAAAAIEAGPTRGRSSP